MEGENEKPLNDFEKIIHLNKLGAIFLSGDKYEKAQSILKKTLDFYLDKREKKQIPNFFYSILYCNLAKVYSCQKDFKSAEPLYLTCIENHPLFKLLLNNNDYLSQQFLLPNIKEIVSSSESLNSMTEKDVIAIYDRMMMFFESKDSEIQNEFCQRIFSHFKNNNLNTIASLADSLTNLAVIYQYYKQNSKGPFMMYCIALMIDQNNTVTNVDYNNFLRESNLKELSDKYIIRRIRYEIGNEVQIKQSDTLIKFGIDTDDKELNFICMKWGTKYDADYVNKLFNGLRRNTQREFRFYCITDDSKGLNEAITPLELKTNFTGWMKKCILFESTYLDKVTMNPQGKICFIDLDMIIYNSIDFLWEYKGNFALMKTDDIQCERSHNGYNSSIIIWRKDFGSEIFKMMADYAQQLTKQLIRFDHYLEFIVKNAEFVQDVFPMKVLDYNTYCKDKQNLPNEGAIIAFPRSPKPHECKEEWITHHWQ